jgi:hypothetical protein
LNCSSASQVGYSALLAPLNGTSILTMYQGNYNPWTEMSTPFPTPPAFPANVPFNSFVFNLGSFERSTYLQYQSQPNRQTLKHFSGAWFCRKSERPEIAASFWAGMLDLGDPSYGKKCQLTTSGSWILN